MGKGHLGANFRSVTRDGFAAWTRLPPIACRPRMPFARASPRDPVSHRKHPAAPTLRRHDRFDSTKQCYGSAPPHGIARTGLTLPSQKRMPFAWRSPADHPDHRQVRNPRSGKRKAFQINRMASDEGACRDFPDKRPAPPIRTPSPA